MIAANLVTKWPLSVTNDRISERIDENKQKWYQNYCKKNITHQIWKKNEYRIKVFELPNHRKGLVFATKSSSWHQSWVKIFGEERICSSPPTSLFSVFLLRGNPIFQYFTDWFCDFIGKLSLFSKHPPFEKALIWRALNISFFRVE